MISYGRGQSHFNPFSKRLACGQYEMVTMPLPTFIIGGVRRGGTTSLYHAIREHPQIYLYPHSELNYFVEADVKGRKWRHNFAAPDHWEASHTVDDYAALFVNDTRARAIGHKGADLLFWPPAHERIARFVPNARFIFSLRNPVNRAWSHYWFERAKGREALEFEAALAAEEERAQKNKWAGYHLSYLARGFYDQNLRRFFKFIPREQVLVITLEEKIAQPRQTIEKIYRFIGVDPELGHRQSESRRNKGWATLPRPWTRHSAIAPLVTGYENVTNVLAKVLTPSRDSRRLVRNFLQKPFRVSMRRVPMPEALRQKLNRRYAPHISALENLLDRSFNEWRSP